MKLIKKSDIAVLAVLLVLCAAGFAAYRHFYGGKPAGAEIYYQSQLVKTVDLTLRQDMRFSIAQKPNVVFHVFKDGSISFEESDCPDRICIRSGRLSMVGQTAACLPNGIILKIVAAGKRASSGPDIIVG
jgi:hypothetical protein